MPGPRPAMKCPSCGAPLAEPAPQCPACKLHLRALDRKFGRVPHHQRYFTDRPRHLAPAEAERLERLLVLFEARFPQSRFSVFVAELPAGTAVGEYAFWLANRGRFNPRDPGAGDNYDLLLLIDLRGHAAALTAGYGLENYLSEQTLQEILARGETSLRRGRLARAIRRCVECAMREMRRRALVLKPESAA